MVRIRFLVLFFTLLASALSARAEDAVNVRASVKNDYTRIVFEWPKAPSYITEQSVTSLTLKFQSAAAFKIEGASPAGQARITSYSTPDAKTAIIGFISGQDVRHFEIGNRVVVDIRGPLTAPAKKDDVKPVVQKTETPKADAPKVPAVPVTKVEKQEALPIAAPKVTDPVTSADANSSLTIQVTSMEVIGLAVFKRFGNLWIVIDQPDYPLSPQISGEGAKKLGTFERVALKEATAFRLALADDRAFHIEGSGLVWKIVSDAIPAAFSSTNIKKTVSADKKVASLLWPVPSARRVIELNDPVVGDTLKVVTVDAGKYFDNIISDYAEFKTLPSQAGLAVESKVDNLDVKKTAEGIVIGTTEGITVSPDSDTAFLTAPPATTKAPAPAIAAASPVAGQTPPPVSSPQLFKFSEWKMGDDNAVAENDRILMAGLAAKDDQSKAQDLIKLAKMQLAYARGPEARGYIELAGQFVPDLTTTPEYIGLKAAAEALSGDDEQGLKDFSVPSLRDFPEISLWKSYELAGLEDWKQAADALPKEFSTLAHYPDAVRVPLALRLSEVALRDADLPRAHELMKLADVEDLSLPYQSALDYMKGEALRQEGKTDDAEKLWKNLAEGKDDLYRAKAGLALTTLQLDKKQIKPVDAVDRLEGLRYAWRGDELETAVNYKLGQMYIANNDPLKGLALLRQAVALSPESEQAKKINDEMAATFSGMFQPNKIKDLNPVDAISLYNEFSTLAPAGPAGDKILRQLADRLVDADLLPRAAALLQTQLDGNKIQGMEGAQTAIRLASIYDQDNKPDKALTALDKAVSLLGADAKNQPAVMRQIDILRAEALSQQKNPEEAFVILARLPQDEEVLRLRADIGWKNQRWQDAADSLEALVNKMQISPTRPASEEEAGVLLNWSVALYLADNRYVLANLREKYTTAMAATAKAQQFEVVTRPRQSALLADRDTINSLIDEADIFKGFTSGSAAVPTAKQAAKTVSPVAPAIAPAAVPVKAAQ